MFAKATYEADVRTQRAKLGRFGLSNGQVLVTLERLVLNDPADWRAVDATNRYELCEELKTTQMGMDHELIHRFDYRSAQRHWPGDGHRFREIGS